MPGPTPKPCTFSRDFLQEARLTVRQRTACWQDVQRFRLVLLLQERPDINNEAAGRQVGLSARQVRRWRQRWLAGELTINDREGRGRKAAFSPAGSRLGDGDRV